MRILLPRGKYRTAMILAAVVAGLYLWTLISHL
jgi:hypothetical protein